MTMAASHTSPTRAYTALLLLADGTSFYGYGIGKKGKTTGEVCFNTGMTGYQEVLSDPSYAGQVITFTFPHIGNVGTNSEDIETLKIAARGLIIREPITEPSNFRAQEHLNDWLIHAGITGISGIDTRALTRNIRLKGAQNVMIAHANAGELPEPATLLPELQALPSLKGMELAKTVMGDASGEWQESCWQLGKGFGHNTQAQFHVVAVDFGEKRNILRCLADLGCRVTIVAGTTSAQDILALQPDGVFLSNGPGDPAATGVYAIPTLQALIAKNIPIFGICLGHQLLGLAMGATTEKMHQGHRGANHPVKDLMTGTVEITSQNHGFMIAHSSLPDEVEVTHVSLFDGTIEGIKHRNKPVFCVQYHPESSPGPHDSHYLFRRFFDLMAHNRVDYSAAKAS
jgi:carbamoyl-phosphate synthase small subunit